MPLVETPEKNKEKDILADIPSPFKNNLFWPDTPKATRKLKEKIPSVATSKDWQEYHRNKENKKLEKEQEIQERKRKRLEGKEIKKNAQEKISKKSKEEPKLNSKNRGMEIVLLRKHRKKLGFVIYVRKNVKKI
jgi:tRNA A37 N6-isopentenylltransferase MiaA